MIVFHVSNKQSLWEHPHLVPDRIVSSERLGGHGAQQTIDLTFITYLRIAIVQGGIFGFPTHQYRVSK